MKLLVGDQDHIKENLNSSIHAFSPAVRDIFEAFEFHTQIDRLAKAALLYLVTEKFASTRRRSGTQMGGLRGTEPEVRGNLQQDGRRARHPPPSDPPDGEPALHRG